MRFATCRRSRFCVYETCSLFRCPFVPSQVHYLPLVGESMASTTVTCLRICLPRMRFPTSPCSTWNDGCGPHRAGTQVQQLSSFTVQTGLAERRNTCLLSFSALRACYSHLWVSPPGKPLSWRLFALTLPRVSREFHRHRHGAHTLPIHRYTREWLATVGSKLAPVAAADRPTCDLDVH
jgi:hypothetical protein